MYKKYAIVLFVLGFSLPSYHSFCQENLCVLWVDESVVLNEVNEFGELVRISEREIWRNEKKWIEQTVNGYHFLYFFDYNRNTFHHFFSIPGDSIQILADSLGNWTIQSRFFPKEMDIMQKFQNEGLNLYSKYDGNEVSWKDSIHLAFQNANMNREMRMSILQNVKERISPTFFNILDQAIQFKWMDFLISPFSNQEISLDQSPLKVESYYSARVQASFDAVQKLKSNEITRYSFWLATILPGIINFQLSFQASPQNKFDYIREHWQGEIKNIGLTRLMLENLQNLDFIQQNSESYFSICTNPKYTTRVAEKL